MRTNELNRATMQFKASPLMPILFIGHGNPLNAITDNTYRKAWREVGENLPKPNAILCISAHWLTKGTYVATTDKPETIHDFYGFPKELFEQQYPSPGAPDYARLTQQEVNETQILSDPNWGLDHGAWSVLMNMFPKANIPTYQLSIDYSKPPAYHYNLAKELFSLRKKGVLIIASGNIVHNLQQANWAPNAKPYDWAIEFDLAVENHINKHNHEALINYTNWGSVAKFAHPTNDHYLPLLYTLGLRGDDENPIYFNHSFDMGSMSMRSIIFGNER